MRHLAGQHLASQGGGFEPQAQDRFEVYFPQILGEAVLKAVATGFTLSENNDAIELTHGNARTYVAGKYNIDAGTLNIRDMVDTPVRASILAWRRLVYDPRTGVSGYASEYKKTGYVYLYGPKGERTGAFQLEGCWPQAVNYGTPDYSAGEPLAIDLTIQFDYGYSIQDFGVAGSIGSVFG